VFAARLQDARELSLLLAGLFSTLWQQLLPALLAALLLLPLLLPLLPFAAFSAAAFNPAAVVGELAVVLRGVAVGDARQASSSAASSLTESSAASAAASSAAPGWPGDGWSSRLLIHASLLLPSFGLAISVTSSCCSCCASPALLMLAGEVATSVLSAPVLVLLLVCLAVG
jgi:hypothetical protein